MTHEEVLEKRALQDKALHYFDGASNFYLTTNMNIDDLRYATPITSAAIVHVAPDEDMMQQADAYRPFEGDVVETAANTLQSLPLSAVTTRALPIAAFGRSMQQAATERRTRMNYAKEKWSAVSFAEDTQAVAFHDSLTKELMALRRAWRTVNTKVTFPDTVSDEALTYFRPDEKYGHGWEMFDAKKHVDVEALDRIATQRLNAMKVAEARASRMEAADMERRGSSRSALKRSPSRPGGSMSPLRDQQGPITRSGSSMRRDGSGSPSSPNRLADAQYMASLIDDIDVRRLVSDEQVLDLFHPDEVAAEIEGLKWDFKEFHPPPEWKRRHERKMSALTRRAAEWRPMSLKRQPVEDVPIAARVTSMPALAPFFSSGLSTLDPKLPIPAAMQGSGVSQHQLHSPHLTNAFVIRPEAAKSAFASARFSSGAVSKAKANVAPVVVEGMRWGDIMAMAEGQ